MYSDPKVQGITDVTVIIHENYGAANDPKYRGQWDIAVVRLNTPLTFTTMFSLRVSRVLQFLSVPIVFLLDSEEPKVDVSDKVLYVCNKYPQFTIDYINIVPSTICYYPSMLSAFMSVFKE